MKIFGYILITCLCLLHAGQETFGQARDSDTIILDETGIKNLRIETAEVEETVFEQTIFALGRIEVLPGKRAIVSSRIPGRAFSVLALPHQEVKAGAELVWVESRQPGDPPPTVMLPAPIAGIISRVDVTVGQPISPDQSLVEIIDLSTVEASAHVPQHLAAKLQIGQLAHIRVASLPNQVFEAKLDHLSVYADAEAGTLEAAFHVSNPAKLLRPGMQAEFNIVISKREGVTVIPRSALQGEASNRFVYVKDFDVPNAFIKTMVQIGEMNDRFVEITSGLLPADEVVTRGAYSLSFAGASSMSLKEALDAAHGHEHAADGSELAPDSKGKDSPENGHDTKEHAHGEHGHDHDHDHHDHEEEDDHHDDEVSPYWMYGCIVSTFLLLLSLLIKKHTTEHEDEGSKVKPDNKGTA